MIYIFFLLMALGITYLTMEFIVENDYRKKRRKIEDEFDEKDIYK